MNCHDDTGLAGPEPAGLSLLENLERQVGKQRQVIGALHQRVESLERQVESMGIAEQVQQVTYTVAPNPAQRTSADRNAAIVDFLRGCRDTVRGLPDPDGWPLFKRHIEQLLDEPVSDEPVSGGHAPEGLDEAYNERNRLVALLARIYPSGIRKTAIEGWDPCWHGCVFVDTPMGQMSWHYHDRDADLFAGLPPYTKDWDGHSTPEKYARLERLTQSYWARAS